MMMSRTSGDPLLDWLRQLPPIVEQRGSDDAAAPGIGTAASKSDQTRVEIIHRRDRDHPTWDIPMMPGDLFPLRAAGMLGGSAQHRPICAILHALRPGESARVWSDHPVGPLCHALEDRCATEVEWRLERDGPDEWTLLLTRR